MPRVRFTLPQVKTRPDSRPLKCPRCGGGILRKHGEVQKPIEDMRIDAVTALRFLCADCRFSFRHYPQGVDRHGQSQRLRAFAAMTWALGLSLRSAAHALAALGCRISRMSVWRAVQEAGSNALAVLRRAAPGSVRVMGADETFMKLRGEKVVVGFVTDAASGQLLGMDVLAKQDSSAFLEWLEGYAREFGVDTLVTDDLATYKPVVDELGLGHQVCVGHVKKNVWNRLRGLDAEWERFGKRIWELLGEFSELGGPELLGMERLVRSNNDLRRLVVELTEKWRSLAHHKLKRGVPATNNCAERTIGRSKIRYKTVRGYKSESGMMNGLGLTQWAWSGRYGLDAGELMAA